MSDNLMTGVVSIALAIVGLAVVAVIFNKNNTGASVINAAGNALGYDIGSAVAPVTGTTPTANSSSAFNLAG